jgi:phenylalanyl-tRNA synthetase alpha chain
VDASPGGPSEGENAEERARLLEWLEGVRGSRSLEDLEARKAALLGRRGFLTERLRALGTLPPSERSAVGERLNRYRALAEEALEERRQSLKEEELRRRLEAAGLDPTLPGRGRRPGAVHPLSRAIDEIVRLFQSRGFVPVDGPEIEDEAHNFTALNIPPEHPARAMHDTFYLADRAGLPPGLLLRTHTSPVQIRSLEEQGPPLRIVAVGRVYRRDADVTHMPMFHQVEGLWVDEQVTFAALKGLLTDVLRAFFARELPVRFRPSYFPFTEPSAEVDVGCVFCEGEGCRVCKGSGWLEVLGSGLVHPALYRNLGLDPERWSGLAFGLGVERLAMLRERISDIRHFYDNDLRFLRSPGGGADLCD